MTSKIILFSILSFLVTALAEMAKLSSTSLFLGEIGPAKVPYIFMLCSVLGPLTSVLLNRLFEKTGKYTFVLVAYHFGLLALFVGTYLAGFLGFERYAIWSYFIITQLNRIIYPIILWSLFGRFLNIFDAKRLFPALISIGECGGIVADILIWKVFFARGLLFFLTTSIGIVGSVLIVLVPIFWLRTVKFSGARSVGSDDHPQASVLRESLIVKLILIVALFSVVGTAISYQFNSVVKLEYPSVGEINKFLGLYGIWCSMSIILFSVVLGAFVFPVVQVVTLQGLVAVLMLAAVCGTFVSPVLFAFMLADFLRNLLKHTLYQASYEQITASLVTKVSLAIKSLTQGFVSPICTLVTGLVLLAFPHIDSFRWLSGGLMVVGGVWFFLALKMRREYLRFHLERLVSSDGETVVRSIQALGEKGNLPAVHALLGLLSESSSVMVKKYTIHSLGNIRAAEVMRVLFQQLYTENEVIQQEAVHSIANYDSFVAQRFLIDFLGGKYCKSLLVRENLIKVLHKVMGSSLIPILLPFLENKDPRVVANTIESMAEAKDRRVIEVLLPFLKHSNNRIRANTVLVLYKFRLVRRECERTIEALSVDRDGAAILSFVYVVGRLKLKKYLSRLGQVRVAGTEAPEIQDRDATRLKVNLAYAYSMFGIEKGYGLFAELFASQSKNDIAASLHHFLQLEPAIRLRVLEWFLNSRPGSDVLECFLSIIDQSQFDFYDEVEILEEYICTARGAH